MMDKMNKTNISSMKTEDVSVVNADDMKEIFETKNFPKNLKKRLQLYLKLRLVQK